MPTGQGLAGPIALAALLMAPASRAADPVDLTYAGGLLTIRCAEARLGDVLEQVRDATGMELVLDASVKSTLRGVDIEAQPVNLALERLLEGSGFTYAMTLAPDGRVTRMYVGGEGGGKAASGPGAAPGRPPGLPASASHPPETAPAPAPPPLDDEDESEAELSQELSSLAGLGADGQAAGAPRPAPSPPPAAINPPASGGPSASGPVAPMTFGPQGGAAYYPVLDPFGRPIPIPRPSPAAAPPEQKPKNPDLQ